MQVLVYDIGGEPVVAKGELVCAARFFDAAGVLARPEGAAYSKAYFERFPGVWHHEISPS